MNISRNFPFLLTGPRVHIVYLAKVNRYVPNVYKDAKAHTNSLDNKSLIHWLEGIMPTGQTHLYVNRPSHRWSRNDLLDGPHDILHGAKPTWRGSWDF